MAHPDRYLSVPVQGTSMAPTLRPGDLCRVRVGGNERLWPGDVVVFWAGRGLVVHRVVVAWGGWVCTRGDNRLWPDGWVRRSRIVGVVVAAERNGRALPLHNRGWARAAYLVFTWGRALCRRGRALWRRRAPPD